LGASVSYPIGSRAPASAGALQGARAKGGRQWQSHSLNNSPNSPAHAKNAEDAAAAAKKETHDKIVARRQQVQSAVTAMNEKVGQQIKSAKDASESDWVALKAKVAADNDYLKAMVKKGAQKIAADRAENYAEIMEGRATSAIDYAITSVELAKLSVLDAILARVDADSAKRS
jgi:hypothetical protein